MRGWSRRSSQKAKRPHALRRQGAERTARYQIAGDSEYCFETASGVSRVVQAH